MLDRPALEHARDTVLAQWGRIDGLINGAGGNQPGATIPPDKTFADLDFESFQQVIDLNLHGTVLPSLIFTPAMIAAGRGAVVNFLLRQRAASLDAGRGLFRRQGRRRKFHALAGG